MPKRKLDQVDQSGSRDGKGENSSRDTMKPSFAIRLTFETVETGNIEKWINGSVDQPDVVDVLKQKFECGRISLEKGTNGQPHFQITVGCFKTRMRRSAVRKYLEEHYPVKFPVIDYCEPCEKTWASFQYCAKQDTHVAGPWEWGLNKDTRDLKFDDLPEPRPFQKEIIDRYDEDAPMFNAHIHWYVDVEGQIGKTMTARMLVLKHGFYNLDGDAQKMKSLAAKNPARGYTLNVVRSKEAMFSYAGLEAISDQFFCDTFGVENKGMIVRKGAHVVVFANWFPDTSKLTTSRLKIWNWNEDEEKFNKFLV